MAFEVKFTKRAELDFERILKYIETEFGSSAAIHFKDLVLDFAISLQHFPELGSVEQSDKNIRGFVVHRRLKVFYRIKQDTVIVLRLFDTRQHPQKQ